jgi:hypothetical protein
MKTIIFKIIVGFILAMGLCLTFNPDPLYLVGLLNPEEAARVLVEGK